MGLIDSIIGVESGGDPTAKNTNSSASGPGQFIDSTWLDTIKAARPDLAQGKSDQELLGLKTDPQLAREMTEAYANQNQAFLSKAGVPVTPGTTYLAHFAGPQGAVKVLQADPNAPVSDILGAAAVKANPFLQGMTAQGLQAWAAKKMGGMAPQPGVQNGAPATPASPPGAPLNISAPPPIFPAQNPGLQTTQNPGLQPSTQVPDAPAFAQIPQMQAPPIFYPPRRPVNLTALRNAISAPVFPRQG
jgi:hypothetical protein